MARSSSPLSFAMIVLLPALSAVALAAARGGRAPDAALAPAVLEDDLDMSVDFQVSLLQTGSELKRYQVARSEFLSIPPAPNATVGTGTHAPERLSVGGHATVVLVAQFLVGHFICVFTRLWNTFRGDGNARPFGERLGSTWAAVPLVLVLLVTAQMRAEQLTSLGQPWTYGVPEWWAEIGIQVAAAVGLVAMVFRLFALMNSSHRLLQSFVLGCCSLCSCVQFLAIGTVLMSTVLMEEPYDIWLNHGRIYISPSLACMQHLIVQAFVISLVWMIATGISELATAPEQSGGSQVISTAAGAGTLAQSMAPMICILFAAARMHSLHARGFEDEPRDWALVFYHLTTNSALVNMLLVVCNSAVREARAAKQDASGSSVGGRILMTLIGLASLCMMVGIVGILLSIAQQQDSNAATSGYTCVLSCMLVLVVQYFAVQIASFMGNLCKPRQDASEPSREPRWLSALTAAEEANTICPVVCSLFLTASARAAEFGASPQGWVEACIYLCMGSSISYLVLVLGTSMAAASPAGEEEPPKQRGGCAGFLAFGQVVSLATVYGASIAIMTGLFQMSASTLAVGR